MLFPCLLALAHATSKLHQGAYAPVPTVLAPELTEPSAPSEAMRAWVRARVPTYGTEDARMQRLLAVLASDKGLVYDASFTGTAQEVFESGRFNCLALAHLLVGLGREVGVEAYYVRVEEFRTYHRADDLLLVSTHVAAAWGPQSYLQLVDVEPVTDRERRMADRISDEEALALHHANRGAEHLVAQRPDLALAWLDRALQVHEGVPEVWVNRGVALRQLGDLEGAVAAYERAIALKPDSLSAWRNLASAREALGQTVLAREMLLELDRRDNRNPYTYLALGDLALQSGDARGARRFYGRARQLSWGNPDVLRALARWAQSEGDDQRAQQLGQRAAQLQARRAAALEEARAGATD